MMGQKCTEEKKHGGTKVHRGEKARRDKSQWITNLLKHPMDGAAQRITIDIIGRTDGTIKDEGYTILLLLRQSGSLYSVV